MVFISSSELKSLTNLPQYFKFVTLPLNIIWLSRTRIGGQTIVYLRGTTGGGSQNDNHRLLLLEMLYGGEIFKNQEFRFATGLTLSVRSSSNINTLIGWGGITTLEDGVMGSVKGEDHPLFVDDRFQMDGAVP